MAGSPRRLKLSVVVFLLLFFCFKEEEEERKGEERRLFLCSAESCGSVENEAISAHNFNFNYWAFQRERERERAVKCTGSQCFG